MRDSRSNNLSALWEQRLEDAANKPIHLKNIVDDGFYSYMAKNARFTNGLEFPILEDPGEISIPTGAIPFSQMNESKNHSECIVFFEKDSMFADALVSIDDFVDELMKHPCIATPDCSLYRDSPLAVQLANIYLNRLIGHYCHEIGMTVIPTCRWGDERTYTDMLFKVPPAFDGLPKNSIYWVGAYGVSKRVNDKYHFRAGLESMIEWLHPKIILVYGSKSNAVFKGLEDKCTFITYLNWRAFRASGGKNGQR